MLAVNIEHSNDEHARIADAILAGHPDGGPPGHGDPLRWDAALLRGLLGMADPTS